MNALLNPFQREKLALLPTPIRPLAAIGDGLFMKQDGLSGPVYGGNKIRKLEFLLGEAQAEGCRSVITYGAVGSNHALATAVCCRPLGLRAISILAPQQTSAHVRKNILMQCAVGAELHLCPDFSHFPEITEQIVARSYEEDGIDPYIIPSGGTNAIGALGFVEASFELAEQMQPDVIYLPMGTGGTLAGLLVGLRLAGLKTRVEAIRVVDRDFRNETHIKQLCSEVCAKLGVDLEIDEDDIIIRDEFFGEDYGIPTPAGREAVEFFKARENVQLENTYTGKTTAALLHDLRSGKLDGQTVLYWNTLNSRDFSSAIEGVDFYTLPAGFHPYFD
ncbi:MAG: pyridoxal-phosphate dependent enzyme [Verrucomicrobia bacterium]|nr:pyridoxal-phosphate dependent enzyme [Verrucomicrobiota bacterium]